MAKQEDMLTCLETITPAQAQEFLKNNTINRKIRKSLVTHYAGCMTRGEWQQTHQGIALDPDMRLLDGQHRMLAIVEANINCTMLVTYNCPPEMFKHIDTGAMRTKSDSLKKNTGVVAIANLLCKLPKGGQIKTSVAQVDEVLEWSESIIEEHFKNCSKLVKFRSAAPIRLAVIIRQMLGQSDYVLPLHKAFLMFDVAALPNSLLILLKQIDSGKTSARDPWDLMARSWIAFDPDRATITNLIYKDVDVALNEMRAAVSAYKLAKKVVEQYNGQSVTNKLPKVTIAKSGYRKLAAKRREVKIQENTEPVKPVYQPKPNSKFAKMMKMPEARK